MKAKNSDDNMKPVFVGGELLGRHQGETATYFEPLVTEAVGGQRFVFLPHPRYIVVLSFLTGQRLGILVLDHDKPDDKDIIDQPEVNLENQIEQERGKCQDLVFVESAALATSSIGSNNNKSGAPLSKALKQASNKIVEETALSSSSQSLFVGCNNGCILEYRVEDLVLQRPSASKAHDMGDYFVPGPLFYPRRCIRVAVRSTQPVKFISFPVVQNDIGFGILGYALIQTAETKQDHEIVSDLSLVRLEIPPYESVDDVTTANKMQDVILAPSEIQQGESETKTETTSRWKSLTSLQYVRTKSKKQKLKQARFSRPLGLLSCPCGKDGGIMVVLARRKQIQLFYNHGKKFLESILPVPSQDQLTALALSPNGLNLACGHASGKIYILTDICKLYYEFWMKLCRLQDNEDDAGLTVQSKPPSMPQILKRKLHWHAHSVATLSYESHSMAQEPMLYSGGVESVLCGWQLARGLDKPAVLLPRIAMDGISSIVHVDSAAGASLAFSGLLIYCIDGTLSLFNAHNLKVKWKSQSIPDSTNTPQFGKKIPCLQMRALPNKSQEFRSLVVFGSPQVAGFVHWLSSDEDNGKHSTLRVQTSLEVAPFNRISRTEAADEELPPPMVTHAAWSESGTTLMTVDVVTTEVSSYGAPKSLNDGTPYGSLTSLKFWTTVTTRGGDPYRVVAELSSPHGKSNSIGAAALSRSGDLGCTVSPEEGSFYLWAKRQRKSVSFSDQDADVAAWYCHYRIAIPSGFSNHTTSPRAISFSADDSTLAICFGNHVTLWDVDDQVLLGALPHANDDLDAVVERVSFMPTSSSLCDMMLTYSCGHVALQSPFGHCAATNLGWCWSLSKIRNKQEGRDHEMLISCVEYVESNDCIAVALYNSQKLTGSVLLLDAESGLVLSKFDPIELPGKITDIASLRTSFKSLGGWDGPSSTKANTKALDLMFVLMGGRMFRWSSDFYHQSTKKDEVQQISVRANRIPSLSDHMFNPRKRAPVAISSLDLAYTSREKKLSLDHFGQVDGQTEGDEELPLLRGAFAKAFLARHLYKKEQSG